MSYTCCQWTDSGIDTRTFTRPKKSNRQNAASKPTSDSPLEVVSTDVRPTGGHLKQPEPSPLSNWSEVNTRTFTRTSPRSRKSQLAADVPDIRSSSGSSDVEERLRCNGGESMMDRAADVCWLSNEALEAHRNPVYDGHLPDMIDMHIVAKAKLQEKGQYCFIELFCPVCIAVK